MAGQHEVGGEAANEAGEPGIAAGDAATPAHRGTCRRLVMHPHPGPVGGCRDGAHLPGQRRLGAGIVAPRAEGKGRTREHHRLAVPVAARLTHRVPPCRTLRGVDRIVIAARDQDVRPSVPFGQHRNQGAQLPRRRLVAGEIEQIADDHQRVVVGRVPRDPAELPRVEVQITDDQTTHPPRSLDRAPGSTRSGAARSSVAVA